MRILLKNTFSKYNLQLKCDNVNLFAQSAWQSNEEIASIPLFVYRILKLQLAVFIWLWSFFKFDFNKGLWFLYLTHWGINFIIIESLFGCWISYLKLKKEHYVTGCQLPWYVKTYWVLFNITTAIAFLITVFYWTLLYGSTDLADYAPNPVLDIMLHGVNSIIMLIELWIVAHPVRLLHIYQPMCVSILYALFGIIYFLAGGKDPFGNAWIYPNIDWNKPGETIVVSLLTLLLLMVMHVVAVGIAALRDLTARFIKSNRTAPKMNYEGTANPGFTP